MEISDKFMNGEQSFHMPTSVTNWAQGDTLQFDEIFYAVQARHTDNFQPPTSGAIWDEEKRECVPIKTEVDLFRVSQTGYSEKYFTINGNFIYWLDSQNGIYKFNPTTKTNDLFIPVDQLPQDFFALKAYDGKYLVYDTYNLTDGYKTFVWDLDTDNKTVLPGESNSFTSYDLDQGNIVYLDNDGGTGDIYVYNIDSKTKKYIDRGAAPRISGNYIAWYDGGGSGYIIKAYNISSDQFVIIPNPDNASRQTPDVYGNKIVFKNELDSNDSIQLFDILTNEFQTLSTSTTYSHSWPSIDENYVVWGKNTGQHISGVEGINLVTKEIFEIQEQGAHQNDNMSPLVLGNVVGWMAWRTGNGDIYGALLSPHSHHTEFSDDFNDGNADGWISVLPYAGAPKLGNWRVEDEYVKQDEGGDHYKFLLDGYNFTNQTVEADILWHENSQAGITVWYYNEDSWVEILYPYPSAGVYGFIVLEKWCDSLPCGRDTNLTSTAYPNPPSVREWQTYKVEANSSTGEIKVYLDGMYQFTHTVGSNIYKSGLSGFNSSNGGGSFDNFKIYSP